ncbi:MAG: outer membrane beta-barrel protein [Ferruginibacter sp.]|nr:outer membrane beta-barrel protein [Ferruginibacter sp.]
MKHCKVHLLILSILLISITSLAQSNGAIAQKSGIIIGNVLSAENQKAIPAATVILYSLDNKNDSASTTTLKDGSFILEKLDFAYYKLQITAIGFASLKIDSIHLRADRFDFDLNDIKLKNSANTLSEVIVFAEKQLIENKDGKITFNVGESALASSTSTTELLKQTPLVNVDNDGKVMLRGKDVKILIDDKPVELNAKQLQDMLESMPGSMIEKIEVMTTPPPQYANERGGVINIVTKKGKVGFGGRVNVSYGSRGELGVSSNVSYRKNKLAINANAGIGYNEFDGNSYSRRQNIYTDSTNYFNTNAVNGSVNRRPNFRLSVDYDFNKKNAINFTVGYNGNNAGFENTTEYINLNQLNEIYRLSNRTTGNNTTTSNPSFSSTYTLKTKDPKEVLRIIATANFNSNNVVKDFFQQYFNPDYSPNGFDSTQQQITAIQNKTLSLRLNYDKPLKNQKFLLSTGASVSRYVTHNVLTTNFWQKTTNTFIKNELLSKDFKFYQQVGNVRAALRYDFKPDFNITLGTALEFTQISFDFTTLTPDSKNNYVTLLPFATLNRKWDNEVTLTFSYKRTIQRPGINELNPSVDYSDPYNTRFGNPNLLPYYADNFDFIIGKWKKKFNVNLSLGYNTLQNIYSSIRTLLPDGKTNITWQNLSGRQEYESSIWGGYTLSKKSKINMSVGYNYNVYSLFDRNVNRYRNGGSFFSTLNGNYQFTDLFGSTVNFTFNRFANPQGNVRSNLSMNIGVQHKFFKKKFIVSANVIDPFRNQQNRNFTYGSNFALESFSTTVTRNYRLGLSYIFSKKAKKVVKKK